MLLPTMLTVTKLPDDPSTTIVIGKFPVPGGDNVVLVEGIGLPEERSKEAYTTAIKKAVDSIFGTLSGWSSGSDYRAKLAEGLAADLLK